MTTAPSLPNASNPAEGYIEALMPKPVRAFRNKSTFTSSEDFYTADQVREAIRAAIQAKGNHEDRSVQDDPNAAQDARPDTGATGTTRGVGTDQHLHDRTGQADHQRDGAECNSRGAGVSSEDQIRKAPEGWRLIKLATTEERSWPEDYAHDNGHYFNTCYRCQRQFMGHKRRVACKVCSETLAASAAREGDGT